jgi:signal transduction histidine kinase
MSGLLKKKLEGEGVPSAPDAEKIRGLIEEAIVKTRRISRGLCPVFLADHGLESLLQELASSISEVHGVSCTIRCQQSILVEDLAMCTHVYYIVHEAIHNAIRHGRADRIVIELLSGAGMATVTVEDNGHGMSAGDATQGMGLKIMKHRAAMIGADLDIASDPDKGTTVTVTFRHGQGREEAG